MAQSPTPRFQPITALPTIAEAIDETLDDAEVQWTNLDAVRDKPYVLDDALVVQGVIRCYGEQRTYVSLYQEQMTRWAKLELTGEQRAEVMRLQGQIQQLDRLLSDILTLAGELKANTIEQIMDRDDAELALDVLLGKLKM